MPYINTPDDPTDDPRYGRQYRVGQSVEVNVGTYTYADVDGNNWRRGTVTKVFYGDAVPSGWHDRFGYVAIDADWDNHFCEVRLLDGTVDSWRVHSLRYPGEAYVDWGH
ncbi:MAG: hypothetical protein AB7N70_26160 [Dehalococcoidia bacterium]